jgi:hypothetical protein
MILIQEFQCYYKKNRQTRITNESRSAYMWPSKRDRGTPVSSTNKTDRHEIAEQIVESGV